MKLWTSCFLGIVLLLASCSSPTLEETLPGKWEVISITNSKSKEENILKDEVGKTFVVFSKDSLEFMASGSHSPIRRRYTLKNDTIHVQNDLGGPYKVIFYDDQRMMLREYVKYDYIFEGEKKQTIEFTNLWKLRKMSK